MKTIILKKMIKKYFKFFLIITFLNSCTLSPGMYMSSSNNWNGENIIFIKSLDRTLKIEKISPEIIIKQNVETYKIGSGDQLSVTIWGLPDVFPITGGINPELNTRRVDSKGNIFFPFVGLVKASDKTQDELREDLTNELSKMFKNIQLDLSIVSFNSQKIYLLGEVTLPKEINLSDIPLSLSDAIGQSKGLNTNTAEGADVFVIRQGLNRDSRIFRVDLSSPAGFLNAGNFFLTDNDIVYVNAKGTTRWNRVISQFFPFSSFLNSVDNLIGD